MRFKIRDKKLDALYFERKKAKKYTGLEEDFITVIDDIRAVTDERGLYGLKSLRYEKLKGKMKGLRSLRLNAQFRLIVRPDQDEKGKYMEILRIEDYH